MKGFVGVFLNVGTTSIQTFTSLKVIFIFRPINDMYVYV